MIITKERKKIAYDLKVWERVLKELPESYKKWFKEDKIYLRKNVTKNATVLDVGCGEGRSLRDVIGITQKLTGVDHDPQAVKKMKNHFKDYPDVKIIKAEAGKLPFDNNIFDFVICNGTLLILAKVNLKLLVK